MSEKQTRRNERDSRATTATIKPTDTNGAFVLLVGVAILGLLFLIPILAQALKH